MRFLKISWVVAVTLARFGGVALSLFLLLLSGMLRLLAAVIGTDDSDDGKAYFWTGDDDGYDQHGAMLTPGEEGRSMVRRTRWL